MTADLVDGLDVEPGTRRTHLARIAIEDQHVLVPVIAIIGSRSGPRVAVTAGIHGSEYVAIEAARRLGMSVDPREVRGSLLVAPISNTTAYHARAIYTSCLDTQNLNRVFPGDPNGSPSQVLADWLFREIIAPSDFYVDMHGGDMIEALVPFVLAPRYGDAQLDRQALQMARATAIPRIIHGEVPGSACGAAAAAGSPAILPEIGGQGVWTEEQVSAHLESALRVLRQVGLLEGTVTPSNESRVYETFAWMHAEASGLLHTTVRVGEQVTEGQRVGAIVDYFGAPLQELLTVVTGEVGFLVTSLAINEGDPIFAILA